jgi:hypothetical protein
VTQCAREIRSHEKRIVELQAALAAERQAREQAEQERDRLRGELVNIANAKPATWDEPLRDQFQQWAQSRARFALAPQDGQP